jgi:hypothetical protein
MRLQIRNIRAGLMVKVLAHGHKNSRGNDIEATI